MALAAVELARWQGVDPRAREVLRMLRGSRRRARRPSKASRERLANRWPAAVERRYVAHLTARLDGLEGAVLAELDPFLALTLDSSTRQDAELRDLIRVVQAVRVKVSADAIFKLARGPLAALGRQLDLFTGRQVDRVVGRVPVVPANLVQAQTAGDVDRWVRDQVARIKTIDSRYFDDLEALIRQAAADGTRTNDLRDLIRGSVPQEHRGRTSAEYNARRIARDQLGSLNGQLTRKRYAIAGVARYRWRTMRDEAVRDAHADQEGKVFDVNGPGAVGAGVFGQDIHPGDDIQCRCRAVPVFDGEDEDAPSGAEVVEEAIDRRRAQLVETYGIEFVRKLEAKAARRSRR